MLWHRGQRRHVCNECYNASPPKGSMFGAGGFHHLPPVHEIVDCPACGRECVKIREYDPPDAKEDAT